MRLEAAKFVRVEPDTTGSLGIPFDTSWLGGSGADVSQYAADELAELPSYLPPPTFVEVFDSELDRHADAETCQSDNEDDAMRLLGRSAREAVDACFERGTEAVLLRNLPMRNGRAFAAFWDGCLDGADAWTPMAYITFGSARAKLDGVDLVTPFPPEMALPCHNEMAYNPREAGRIAFFCFENAPEGGETLLTRNADLTGHVAAELQRLVRDHGGIAYRREYYDGAVADVTPNPMQKMMGTWQARTGTEDRAEAVKFFHGHRLRE